MSGHFDECVYAYTEIIPESYPGYVNISEVTLPTQEVGYELRVRSRGNLGNQHAKLVMTEKELREMGEALVRRFAPALTP